MRSVLLTVQQKAVGGLQLYRLTVLLKDLCWCLLPDFSIWVLLGYMFAECFCSVSVFTAEFGVMHEGKISSICFHCSLFSFPFTLSGSLLPQKCRITSTSVCRISHFRYQQITMCSIDKHCIWVLLYTFTYCTDKATDKAAQGSVGNTGSRQVRHELWLVCLALVWVWPYYKSNISISFPLIIFESW